MTTTAYTLIILIAIIPYIAILVFAITKISKLEKTLQLHRDELIRLGHWSQNAAKTIHEITQHLKYIVDMDKVKKEFPLMGPKGEA